MMTTPEPSVDVATPRHSEKASRGSISSRNIAPKRSARSVQRGIGVRRTTRRGSSSEPPDAENEDAAVRIRKCDYLPKDFSASKSSDPVASCTQRSSSPASVRNRSLEFHVERFRSLFVDEHFHVSGCYFIDTLLKHCGYLWRSAAHFGLFLPCLLCRSR